MRNLVLPLAALVAGISSFAACDLLLGPPPVVDDDNGRPDNNNDDDCNDDDDCDGGEFCDDGTCREIGDEGEGEGGEGEGEPPPPPPPECTGAGCPSIVSLSINPTALDQFGRGTVSAIVTDPDGVDDVIGGTLLDPISEAVYGTFTSQGGGAYEIDVTWDSLGSARAIDFVGSTDRTLRARFFDQAGNDVFGDVSVELVCDGANSACDGVCNRARCDGVCRGPDDFNTESDCGFCGNVCSGGAVCEPRGGSFGCVGGAGEGEGEGEGELVEYSGAREDGVVCGVDVCNVACCVDPFGGTGPFCADACPIGGGTCDGPEDCGFGEECCANAVGADCAAEGECRAGGNREVCVNSGDCEFDEVCCTDPLFLAFGVDAGVCTVGESCGGSP